MTSCIRINEATVFGNAHNRAQKTGKHFIDKRGEHLQKFSAVLWIMSLIFMPVGVLGAVCASVMVIVAPFALALGWTL
ncbi:MAG: hypothetical protein RSC52_01755 [Oscillospiraceae bacterium]